MLQLLNDQWPQSKTIRLRRLERSSDDLPTSFLLVNEKNELIGYCYVDRLFDEENGVIVESVCIQRSLRGQGFGKRLMALLEEKLRGRFARIYLTTADQREFYSHCGYEETSPRVRFNVSSRLFAQNADALKNLLSSSSSSSSQQDSHLIVQKGSTIERITTVWMKKDLKQSQSQ